MEIKTGKCHCGATEIEVKVDVSKGAMMCNCSICSRTGWMLAFVSAEELKITKEGPMTDYQFGKKSTHHPFCTTCGIRVFSKGQAPDGTTAYSVNVRCLEGVNPQDVPVQHYDGAAL